MIRAQQKSIDSLKQMLSQLLEDKKKKPRPRFLPKSPKANEKKGKARLLHILRRIIPTLSHPSLHPKREAIQRMRALISKG